MGMFIYSRRMCGMQSGDRQSDQAEGKYHVMSPLYFLNCLSPSHTHTLSARNFAKLSVIILINFNYEFYVKGKI